MRYDEDDVDDDRNWSEEECDMCGAQFDCGPPWYGTKCGPCKAKIRAVTLKKREEMETIRKSIRDAMTEEVRP